MNKPKYYAIGNPYFANSLSFLGFSYMKWGEGKETIYTFKDTARFRVAMEKLKKLKVEVGISENNRKA